MDCGGKEQQVSPGASGNLAVTSISPSSLLRPLRGLPAENTEKVRVLRDNICNSHPVLITRRVRCSLSSGSCEEQTPRIHTRSQLDLTRTHSASFSVPSDSPPGFPLKPAHLSLVSKGDQKKRPLEARLTPLNLPSHGPMQLICFHFTHYYSP